jgi:hypothetical protein
VVLRNPIISGKIIIYAVALFVIVGVVYVLFEKNSYDDSKFKSRIDSLKLAAEQLERNILKKDSAIAVMNAVDMQLLDRFSHQQTKIIVEREKTEAAVEEVSKLNNSALVSNLNKRYPGDTISNLLPIAEPVILNTAVDLVRYDGAKKEIVLKDSTILILEGRVQIKDKMIDVYKEKETDYKNLVTNKDTQIDGWEKEYEKLKSENKKLFLKNKLHKMANYVLLGGAAVLLIAK